MKYWLRISLVALAVSSSFTSSSWAEGGNGADRGGGDVFICKGRVYLADTYPLRDTEAFQIFKKLNQKASFNELLSAAIQAAGNLDPESQEFVKSSLDPNSPNRIVFERTTDNLKDLPDDDLEVPPECDEKRQLAIQTLTRNGNSTSSHVIYQGTLFDDMTPAERVFFLLHEVYIRRRLESEEQASKPNTQDVRDKVASISKGKAFVDLLKAVASFHTVFGDYAREAYLSILEENQSRLARIFENNGMLYMPHLGPTGFEGKPDDYLIYTKSDIQKFKSALLGHIVAAKIPAFHKRFGVSLAIPKPSVLDRGRSVPLTFEFGYKKGKHPIELYDVQTGKPLLTIWLNITDQSHHLSSIVNHLAPSGSGTSVQAPLRPALHRVNVSELKASDLFVDELSVSDIFRDSAKEFGEFRSYLIIIPNIEVGEQEKAELSLKIITAKKFIFEKFEAEEKLRIRSPVFLASSELRIGENALLFSTGRKILPGNKFPDLFVDMKTQDYSRFVDFGSKSSGVAEADFPLAELELDNIKFSLSRLAFRPFQPFLSLSTYSKAKASSSGALPGSKITLDGLAGAVLNLNFTVDRESSEWAIPSLLKSSLDSLQQQRWRFK